MDQGEPEDQPDSKPDRNTLHMVVCKEEEDEPPHIKEEQEEPGEPMLPLEAVKSESDDKDSHSSDVDMESDTEVTEDSDDWDEPHEEDISPSSQTKLYSCSECPCAFTSQVFFHTHIRMRHNDLYRQMLRNGQIASVASSQKQGDTDQPRSSSRRSNKTSILTAPSIRSTDKLRPSRRTIPGKKPHVCKHCDKSFKTPGELKTHTRVHTGERPYQCKLCDKSYALPSRLKTHERIHTGEKPFRCKYCDNSYILSSHLKTHERIHTEQVGITELEGEEEAETMEEELTAGAGPLASSGDAASPTAYPSVWNDKQFNDFQSKNEWLFARNGKLGCTACRDVKHLGLQASCVVNIAVQWADGKIGPNGKSRDAQLKALRKKIIEHRDSKTHKDAVTVHGTAMEDRLFSLKCASRGHQSVIESTAKVFRTAYYVAKNNKPFADFENLIDLQQANSTDLGYGFHSKSDCVDIIDQVSSQMKQRVLNKIIETRSKITLLADELTTIGHKSTLIVFLRASVDGDTEPVAIPLDLIELDSLHATHIKEKLMDCLLKNGFTIELLQEVFIGFCSDGASVMLGVKSGVGKLLQDDFPGIVLWHCLNHRLQLAVDQALDATGGTKDFEAFLDCLHSLYSQSAKTTQELVECAHNLVVSLRKIGVFGVRWVASSFEAVSAVWDSFPALAEQFRQASEDGTRDSGERDKFQDLLSMLCSINFVKSLAVMADVLTKLKDLSERLQNGKITLPKAHDNMTKYVKRIESLNRCPGEHAVEADQAEKQEVLEFKGEKLSVGKSPIINTSQFIQAVADNIKERLFTTSAEDYNSLFNQMAVLNPNTWDNKNPQFGEEEVRALCRTLHVNEQEAHLGFTEYKANGGRSIPNKMKKLLLAVDTLSACNADCEQGFNSVNNIISNHRSTLSTKNAANLLFISTVGPPCKRWDPMPYVRTWMEAARSTDSMARSDSAEENTDNYYKPMWSLF